MFFKNYRINRVIIQTQPEEDYKRYKIMDNKLVHEVKITHNNFNPIISCDQSHKSIVAGRVILGRNVLSFEDMLEQITNKNIQVFTAIFEN